MLGLIIDGSSFSMTILFGGNSKQGEKSHMTRKESAGKPKGRLMLSRANCGPPMSTFPISMFGKTHFESDDCGKREEKGIEGSESKVWMDPPSMMVNSDKVSLFPFLMRRCFA